MYYFLSYLLIIHTIIMITYVQPLSLLCIYIYLIRRARDDAIMVCMGGIVEYIYNIYTHISPNLTRSPKFTVQFSGEEQC